MEKDCQNNVNSEGNQSGKNRFTFVDFSLRGFGRFNVSDSDFMACSSVQVHREHRCRPAFQYLLIPALVQDD